MTGVAVIPVSVAQLQVSLGEYELSEDGEVVETGRAEEDVVVPLAHTEGGLTASVQRGAKAVAESGGFRTYVVADRITRASCFVCKDAGDALDARALDRGAACRRCASSSATADIPELSRLRGPARGEDARRRPDVPRPLALHDRRRGRAEHDDPQRVRAEHGVRAAAGAGARSSATMLEANMGGDKKPSFEFFQSGHGKTVIAETTLTDEAIRRVLRTTAADLEALAWAGRTAPSRRGCSRSRSRRRRRSPRSSPRPARTSAWSARARWRTAPSRRVEGGLHVSIRFPGLEVGTVGGGTTLPTAARVARADGLRRRRQGLPLRAARRGGRARARDQRLRGDGDRRLRELLPRPLRARRAALAGRADAVAELAVVLGLVVVTPRLGDEPVGADRPLLEAGDAHPLARLGARAGERPVVLDESSSKTRSSMKTSMSGKAAINASRDLCYPGRLAAVDGIVPPGA